MSAKDTVVSATTSLFGDRDLSAIGNYFGSAYTQHSALAKDGIDGLRELASGLPADFSYELVRVIEDGDLVVTHGVYRGFGPDPLVAFDVWRVVGGRIVEHWDSLTPVVSPTASGRSQTDGPTAVSDLDKTAANKALVSEWAQKVLIGGDYSVLTDYISTAQYDQHNPEAADGLDGFGAAVGKWAEAGKQLNYVKVHHLIGEGDFVFTRSEGAFGKPSIYNDLWRLKDGHIVEHWDIVDPVRTDLPHNNGVF